MNTGEDAQGLRKIIDLTRFISLVILGIHFYLLCYQVFLQWGITSAITDRLLGNMAKVSLFKSLLFPKLAALLFLAISLIGVKGKKNEKQRLKPIVNYLFAGLLLYFISTLCLYLQFENQVVAFLYIGITMVGYLLVLSGATLLSRLIKANLNKDVFNSLGETFPQEERLLENEYSINLPAKYKLKDKVGDSWINIINPFRGILVAGTPGAGKSYFVIRYIIEQHIKKGFSMFIYDYKYDDLSKITYNMLLKYHGNYKVKPKFFVINFDEMMHRCNPLDPDSMEDITDASEASRTIMLGLNRDWIKKTGDFFVESAVNFVTAVIWYLRKYKEGKYCTLPHAIELMQVDYDKLFAVMEEQEEVRTLINPFVSALRRKAAPQLEGQIASAKIGLARLASPQLYYTLSGNDFTLDINNPLEPKIVCMGSNPQKQQIYGAVLSLYISRMIKLVNRKGQLKSSLVFDEFPSIFLNGIDGLLATSRSNLVCTTLAVQTFEQLKKDYGADQAAVLSGITGNLISGQVTGDTAKKLSENFGKIMQERQSLSINSSDVSVSKSTQLEYAIPAAKIATLSSGEFVGFVADNPDQKIALKLFHSEIQNDHESIAREEARFKSIPKVNHVSHGDVVENYLKIKQDIEQLVALECEKLKVKYGVKESVLEKTDNAEKADGNESGEEQAVVL